MDSETEKQEIQEFDSYVPQAGRDYVGIAGILIGKAIIIAARIIATAIKEKK